MSLFLNWQLQHYCLWTLDRVICRGPFHPLPFCDLFPETLCRAARAARPRGGASGTDRAAAAAQRAQVCSGKGPGLFQPPPRLACCAPPACCRPGSKPGRRSPTAASTGTGQCRRRSARPGGCRSAGTKRSPWGPLFARGLFPGSAQKGWHLSSLWPVAAAPGTAVPRWLCRRCRGSRRCPCSQRCPQPAVALSQVAGAEPARLRHAGSGRPAAAAGAALGEERRGGPARVPALLLPARRGPRRPAPLRRVGENAAWCPAAGRDGERRCGRGVGDCGAGVGGLTGQGERPGAGGR